MNQAIPQPNNESEKVDISASLNKVVVQDICIQHHRFNFKPHKVPHQKMNGAPTTIYKVNEIFDAIKKFKHQNEEGIEFTFLNYGFERDGRYGHSIVSLELKDNNWIELVLSTIDFQAENFFKQDKLSGEQEYVSFSQHQGAKKFAHVLIKIDHSVGSKGTFGDIYLEANKGITANVIKKLFEEVLLNIKDTGKYPHLFQEIYRPDVTKNTFVDIETRMAISPIADETVLNKILTNDYLKIELRDKWLQEPASDEVNFLEQTAKVHTFQPTGVMNTPITREKFTEGLRNLITNMRKDTKAKANTVPTIHLTYFEGERERTIELDLKEKLADVASKKTWLKDFSRQPITEENFIDNALFQTIRTKAAPKIINSKDQS